MDKITATPEAIEVIEKLKAKHGNLLFEQSYGCCEGTTPMCYPADGHYISSQLELIGTIVNVPYYMDKKQLKYMAHMQQTLDVSQGNGASFSLESSEGLSFTLQSTIIK
ncbi:MAG: DUF779 domain-containing protein [Lysinibacillus sp.]